MYQIGEHIMYKNIGICVVEEIGKPGFSADKARNIIRCVRWMRRATHGYVPVDSDIFMRNIITKKKPAYLKAQIHGSGSLFTSMHQPG